MSDVYRVEFLFKGLFLFWPFEDRVEVLLPEAAGSFGPGASYCDKERPLRQHTVMLEMPRGADWNRGDFAGNRIVYEEGQEDRREFLHWRGKKNDFAVLNEFVSPPSEDEDPYRFNTHLKSTVQICDDDSDRSVHRLVRFEEELAENPAPDYAAKATFRVGRACSNRRSENSKGEPVLWIEIPARLLKTAIDTDTLKQLLDLLDTHKRTLNLDLHVAMDLPLDSDEDHLEIQVPGNKTVRVKKPANGGTHRFVVRNQEWPEFLLTTKELKDAKGEIPIDYDHEYLAKLVKLPEAETDDYGDRSDDPRVHGIAIPVSTDSFGLSPAGQGCGGASGGGG